MPAVLTSLLGDVCGKRVESVLLDGDTASAVDSQERDCDLGVASVDEAESAGWLPPSDTTGGCADAGRNVFDINEVPANARLDAHRLDLLMFRHSELVDDEPLADVRGEGIERLDRISGTVTLTRPTSTGVIVRPGGVRAP